MRLVDVLQIPRGWLPLRPGGRILDKATNRPFTTSPMASLRRETRMTCGLLSELCTEDADFVVITGRHLKGREEIFTYHHALHQGTFKNRTLSARLKDLRFIQPDVALGHLNFEGADTSGDERRKTTAFATIVLAKEQGKWLIAAFHNTLLSGPPGGVLPSDSKSRALKWRLTTRGTNAGGINCQHPKLSSTSLDADFMRHAWRPYCDHAGLDVAGICRVDRAAVDGDSGYLPVEPHSRGNRAHRQFPD